MLEASAMLVMTKLSVPMERRCEMSASETTYRKKGRAGNGSFYSKLWAVGRCFEKLKNHWILWLDFCIKVMGMSLIMTHCLSFYSSISPFFLTHSQPIIKSLILRHWFNPYSITWLKVTKENATEVSLAPLSTPT